VAVKAVRVQIPPTASKPWLGSQGFLGYVGCFSDIIAGGKSLAARYAGSQEVEPSRQGLS
jgi:hypothetical protein